MKRVFISGTAPREVGKYLHESGYEVFTVSASPSMHCLISSHPDIFICSVGREPVFANTAEIGSEYPQNAAFCAAALDRYFIHNLNITAPRLLEIAERAGLKPVHVNQGYTKCSCAVVDGKSVITSDKGIARALIALGDVDVLEVNKGHILLPGYQYGFIGGASGRVGEEFVFCGDITVHSDFERIQDFVESRGVRLKWFDFPLTDVGSIIEE